MMFVILHADSKNMEFVGQKKNNENGKIDEKFGLREICSGIRSFLSWIISQQKSKKKIQK